MHDKGLFLQSFMRHISHIITAEADYDDDIFIVAIMSSGSEIELKW